jgi:hypothetical protein
MLQLLNDMDFVGQKIAEARYQKILIVAGIVGTLLGFAFQNFQLTLFVIGTGALVALFVCVPSWPQYRLHPLSWLPKEASPSTSASSGSARKKKSR